MNKLFGIIFFYALIFGINGHDTAWASVAGKIQFVTGEIKITNTSEVVRDAVKGDEVHAGESIVTGRRGVIQLRMIDNGLISIRPNSRLKIDEYRYKNSKDDRTLFSLLKGSFRSITGLIGKHRRKSWQTRTATAVLGVRGSDADIGYDPALQLTAIRTYTGGYTLTPNDPSVPPLEVNAGGIGTYTLGTPPKMTTTFVFAPPAPKPQAAAADSHDQQRSQVSVSPEGTFPDATHVSGAAPDPSTASSTLNEGTIQASSDLVPPLFEQLPVVSETPAPLPPAPLPPAAAVAYANILKDPVGGFAWGSTGSHVVANAPQTTAILGQNSELLSMSTFTGPDNVLQSFDANTALLQSNSVQSIPATTGNGAYKVGWGVWSGNYTVIAGGIPQTPGSDFHYAWSDSVTTSAELSALSGLAFTYAMIGGGAANESGASSTAFNVNASGRFAADPSLGIITVNGNANFPTGSTNWQFDGSGTIAELIDPAKTVWINNASCSNCGPNVSGLAGGQFVGAGAEGLLLNVQASDAALGIGFVGTAVLKR